MRYLHFDLKERKMMIKQIISSILFDPEMIRNGWLSDHVRNELLDAYALEGDPFPDRSDEETRWLGENLLQLGGERALAAACIGRAARLRGLTEQFRPIFEWWAPTEPKILSAFDEGELAPLPRRVDQKTLDFNLGRYWATNW